MLHIVVGTRPEIIKMAPIVLELEHKGLPFKLIHTGQHYEPSLSGVFFEELGLPRPEHRLEVGSGSHSYQTAQAMMGLEGLFSQDQEGIVLVQGDTNTTLAAGLAGVKLGLPVAHVEAGLRSRDLRMPEEHNRRIVDHVSSILLAPTDGCAKNLREESVWGRIHVTGNTVLDACRLYMHQAERHSSVMESIPFSRYILATLHRAENVDNPRVLESLVEILTKAPEPVVYPAHPRTVERLKATGLLSRLLKSPNILVRPPVGYFDFLILMRRSACILTDSGGIQEEATAPQIRRRVFVLRRTTERPEAVETGFASLVGTNPSSVLRALESDPWEVPESMASPYGDGFAAKRIVDILEASSADEVPTMDSEYLADESIEGRGVPQDARQGDHLQGQVK